MYKAIERIPLWAERPNQYNHKIVRAYLLLKKDGQVALNSLKQRCSNNEVHPDTYVPKFQTNFANMKTDSSKSHGKVFVEENGIVTIWEPIKKTLQNHSASFLRSS